MTAPALDLETMAATLAQSPDFRVLRRFVGKTHYADEDWNFGDPARTRLALYIDTETTDLDREACAILEFAAVQFSYDAENGQVLSIVDEYQGFEESARAISAEAQSKHGITAEMVKGQELDEGRIRGMLAKSAIVIAHNASFDRPVVERRLVDFETVPFACSFRDVPWDLFGCDNAKLSTILATTCREFYEAHHALDDCRVGVHVLASSWVEDTSAMSYLLDNARRPTVRVWANGSPFDSKEMLKARGYKWAGGVKKWYRDMRQDDAQDEANWLVANAGVRAPTATAFDAKDKYSMRMEK
jgi:DNA polymerase-3 subunit epsilon